LTQSDHKHVNTARSSASAKFESGAKEDLETNTTLTRLDNDWSRQFIIRSY